MKFTFKQLLTIPVLSAMVMLASLSLAQDSSVPGSLRAKLSQALEISSQNQLQILSIKKTPLSQMFEVELNTGEILYSDMSGDYLFAGDMYETSPEGLVNLSSATRQVRTVAKIDAVSEEEMILFTPNEVKSSITVFTDVDCTYCRALHREIEALMDYGIQVRYLAYPRGGVNADSYDKMISVWCADDRHRSLTQAKNGQNLPARDCETPILEHYELGNELGINGTPALVLPDGRLIPGYMEADRIAAMLGLN